MTRFERLVNHTKLAFIFIMLLNFFLHLSYRHFKIEQKRRILKHSWLNFGLRGSWAGENIIIQPYDS